MIKIVIVDDQNSIREFLKVNLSTESGIEVVGMADSAQSAIIQAEEYQPNVILMDIEMPGDMDGIDATKIISQRFPNTKILLFTSQDNRYHLNRALEVGARGYILKNTSIKDIGNIIRLTEKGFFQIGPIFGNWNDSRVNNYQYEKNNTEYIASKVGAIVQQEAKYADEDQQIAPLEINYAISDLTTGIFELQQTIRSQEDRIINLTSKYSEVQHEIETKREKEKRIFNGKRGNIYNSRVISQKIGLNRQNFLFISSFCLGVFTVIILMLVITFLGSVL